MSADRAPPLWPPDVLGATSASRRGTLLWVLALAVVAFWDLGGRSIFHRDLPRFAVIAREMIQSGDWLVPRQHGETYANKPILYVWCVALPSALAGDPTAFLLRLPSALALLGCGLATAWWARARGASLPVARVAGFLVVTTLLTNEMGRTGRPDMLATALATLGAALLDRAALGRGRPRDPWLAGLVLGAGLLTKGPVVFLVPAAVLLVPTAGTTRGERLARARPVLVLLVALAVGAAWVVPAWLREGPGFVRRLVVDQVGERVAGRGNHLEGPLYYLLDLPAVLLPWAPLTLAALLAAATRRGRAALRGGPLAAVVAATALVLSAVPTKEVRYASILVPPLSLLGAQAAAWLAARTTDAARARRHLATLGAGAVALGLAAAVPVARWPASAPWVVPPALFVVGSGLLAVRTARRTQDAAPRTWGRFAGLVAIVVGAGFCVFWGVFARYLVVSGRQENEAVAAVLPPHAPTAILLGRRLEPDDLFEAVRRPIPLRAPEAVPRPDAHPRLVVVCTEGDRDAVAEARGEAPTVLLDRPRARGGRLLVLRFGP